MQPKSWNVIPRRLRQTLGEALDGHLNAHLAADHFTHPRKLPSRQRRAKSSSRVTPKYEIVAGLPIYSASCGSLARQGLRELQAGGWLLLVKSVQGVSCQVEAQAKAKNKGYVVSRVSTGALANHLENAMESAGISTTGRRGSRLEFRALRIPAMHIFAVWIHRPSDPERHVLIPFTPNFAGLRSLRSYKRQQAERLLKKHATAMILRWYERHYAQAN